LPDSINADNVFVDENKKLIESLAFIYNLDELKMVNILRGSVNQYGVIDKKEFRKIARNNYLIKEGSLPKLLNKCQPLEYVKKDKTGSKKDRMINFFETTTPFNFLKFKNNNSKPTKRDLEIVEELIVDLKLNPGVVNVLLDYVFRINNNKLVKNFVHAIAGQWKRNNIKTVEEAMNIAESEYKKTINNKNRKSKNSDITPKWFDKNINKKNITENDKNKLDTLLKDFN